MNLLEQNKELLKALKSLTLSMMAHPDCEEGSEFDDYTNLSNELIRKIDKTWHY